MKIVVRANVVHGPEDMTTTELANAISKALRRVYLIRQGSPPVPVEIPNVTIQFGEDAT